MIKFFVSISAIMLCTSCLAYAIAVPPTHSHYKLVIVKESGFYNIYTFHSFEAASTASEYLKENIHSELKEKIIAD